MLDAISTTVITQLGVKFLEQGISFLWKEAGTLLDRYRKKKDSKVSDSAELEDLRKVEGEIPEVVKSDLKRQIQFDELELVEKEMEVLREEVEIYQETYHKFRRRVAQKGDDVTRYDQEQLAANARLFYDKGLALKKLVERVYGEEIELVELPDENE